MKIDHLIYFYEVSRRKSLNEAAKYLHLSQPSLSASMRSLEEELEICLFYRTNNGISLTDAGKTALEHIKIILEQYNILCSLKNYEKCKSDPVILFVQRSLSRIFLSPELIEYIKYSKLILRSDSSPSEPFDTKNDKGNTHFYLKFYPKEMLSLVKREAEKQKWRVISLATGSVCLYINSCLELVQKQKICLTDLNELTFASSHKSQMSIYDHNKIFRHAASPKNSVVFPDRQAIFDAIAKSKNIYTISPKFDILDNFFIREKIIVAREFEDFSLPLVFCLLVPSLYELNIEEKEVVSLVKKQFTMMRDKSVL